MAYFAQIENNIVTRVIAVSNSTLLDENNVEQEQKGIAFCKVLLGEETEWVQTSYNAKMRNKFAGIGDEWHSELNAFISPKPYGSWTLNTETKQYEAPTPMPTDGKRYLWDEQTLTWKESQNETKSD
jgi:hypothetical protein